METRPSRFTTVFLLLFWLLAAFPCWAGEQDPPPVTDSLEDLSAAETLKGKTFPREWPARTPRKRGAGLVVSVDAVLGKSSPSGEAVLVDVRESAQFAGLRIPSSINLPLFAVKSKSFLKDRTLVLLNEGYSYGDLEEESSRLRESGFNASILDGGLRRWIEGGGAAGGSIRPNGSRKRLRCRRSESLAVSASIAA